MSASLLIAKLSLLGVLFTFLPLYAGVRRWRRGLTFGLVAALAALVVSAADALSGTSLHVAGLHDAAGNIHPGSGDHIARFP